GIRGTPLGISRRQPSYVLWFSGAAVVFLIGLLVVPGVSRNAQETCSRASDSARLFSRYGGVLGSDAIWAACRDARDRPACTPSSGGSSRSALSSARRSGPFSG